MGGKRNISRWFFQGAIHLFWTHPCTEFSGNISAAFAQILKYNFTVEFNEFISTSHGMDEMNFRNWNFFSGLGFPIWGR